MPSKISGCFGRVRGLSALLISISLLRAPGARAWGLSTDLNSVWVNSALVQHVINHREIDYCVEIEEARFVDGAIQRQVEAVLRMWLKPLEELGIRDVAVKAVDCASGTLNLKIQIAPEQTFVTLGSYQLPVRDNGRYVSLVKIDSKYTYPVEDKSYQFVDFQSFVPAGRTLDSVMNQVSVESPMTVQAFADSISRSYYEVYLSTYRVLIHEIGHSFGLCDTYASQIAVHCDSEHMSAAQPSSIMKDSNYFYLTEDDLVGIRALFTRYMH